jgi:hypothetical protein
MDPGFGSKIDECRGLFLNGRAAGKTRVLRTTGVESQSGKASAGWRSKIKGQPVGHPFSITAITSINHYRFD